MKIKLALCFLLLVTLLISCQQKARPTPTATSIPTITPTSTSTLGQPEKYTTSVPDASNTILAYLDAWKAEDYETMYSLLTAISRDAISQDDFTARYSNVYTEAALTNIDYEILASLVKSPYASEVSYRVTLHSILVGDIQRDTVMHLSLEAGQWRVQWDSTLILPELAGGNYLKMEYHTPSRGNIYDQNGHALAAYTDAWALGLDTGLVSTDYETALLSLIYEATGKRPEEIRPTLDAYRISGWYLPIADLSAEEIEAYYQRLLRYDGVLLNPFRARYYSGEGVAAHVTGYVAVIQADQVEQFKRLGYNPWSDRVGQAGLERWGESYLAGKRGGTLSVIAPDNSTVTILASTEPQAADSIYTTIDKDLQEEARSMLKGFGAGAIVVLERDTGRVLAMASTPGYNPNLFEPSNRNSSELIAKLFDPQTLPLYNRATQGQYPLGSVFKIINMSAALQSDLYTAESEYLCGYHFTELSDITLNDWTWDHYLKDGRTQASGLLTLPEGLMRSCNPWFFHIGLDLYDRGMTLNISNMARGFGLGQPTGIEIAEEGGNIPDPTSRLDATNLAIGQGNTLVTPLQVADFVAAVGNGGTLYRPSVVEKIVDANGDIVEVFTPTIRGTLPISPTLLQVVQDAMITVLGAHGTAVSSGKYLSSYRIAAAGKTGTAETGYGYPHAWFAGYTFVEDPDRPDIAVAVLVENTGEGSEWAAPIFARIVRMYFYPDKPREPLPWESQAGVWKTPTPTPTP
jgi:penicillin-binding protein 2